MRKIKQYKMSENFCDVNIVKYQNSSNLKYSSESACPIQKGTKFSLLCRKFYEDFGTSKCNFLKFWHQTSFDIKWFSRFQRKLLITMPNEVLNIFPKSFNIYPLESRKSFDIKLWLFCRMNLHSSLPISRFQCREIMSYP